MLQKETGFKLPMALEIKGKIVKGLKNPENGDFVKRDSPVYTHSDEEKAFFTVMLETLNIRARNILTHNKIDNLEKFMGLDHIQLIKMKNCGKKSIAEISRLQAIILEESQNGPDTNRPGFGKARYEIILNRLTNYSNDKKSEAVSNFDLDMPFASLVKWLSTFTKSEKERRAFMLRNGMLGNRRMTLEQIGRELGITRERVRQILVKVEKQAQSIVHEKCLQPLIARAAELVQSNGGTISKNKLALLLLVQGSNDERLKFATPFIDFLATLSYWEKIGLHLKRNEVFTTAAKDICSRISPVITEIAWKNADEVIDQDLWSIDANLLKLKAVDWCNKQAGFYTITTISDLALKEALSSSELVLRQHDARVYSAKLWKLRYGRLYEAGEEVLIRARKAMHFTEICFELKKWRSSDKFLSDRNVHALLSRNGNLLLWDRGTFIHRMSISVPHKLLKDIESWVLNIFKEDIPFISAYGAFKYFKKECIDAGIPSETALYTLLKESAHPLLAYPRLPYIYRNLGYMVRIPVPLAFEQYIQDAGGSIAYDEVKSFAVDRIFLKDYQFNNIVVNLPNVIRTKDWGFIHKDYVNLDNERLNDIATYTQEIIKKEGHVSVERIFKDKIINCRIQGINSPQSLFSLFQMFHSDKLLASNYPQLRPISDKEAGASTIGLVNKVVAYIKGKKSFCSYQELQEVFVERLGYKENNIYMIASYKEDILRYMQGCLIHKDTIEWNELKQNQLENLASSYYQDALKTGKYFGLIKPLLELPHLPELGNGIYWTSSLLADLLVNGGKFRVLGNAKNAFLPTSNEYGIMTFEDLIYVILNNEYRGAANLDSLTESLREAGVIKKSITQSMLGASEKVIIVGKEILLKELAKNA